MEDIEDYDEEIILVIKKIEKNLKNLLPGALRKIKNELNDSKTNQQGGRKTELDPNKPLPNYPDF